MMQSFFPGQMALSTFSLDDPKKRFLTCPKCGERLIPADVENYSRCPFCDYLFVHDDAWDDFILAPVISSWEQSQNPLTVVFQSEIPKE